MVGKKFKNGIQNLFKNWFNFYVGTKQNLYKSGNYKVPKERLIINWVLKAQEHLIMKKFGNQLKYAEFLMLLMAQKIILCKANYLTKKSLKNTLMKFFHRQ